MRLDAFVAHATGLTRRDARTLIARGRIRVPDQPRLKAGLVLKTGQQVMLDDVVLAWPAARYLMLHKPAGVVSSTSDRDGVSVLQLLPPAWRRDLHIAGRLDLDTTGLLLLSTDGQWTHRITSPRTGCRKVYRVTTAVPLTDAMLAQLAEGVQLRGDDQATRPATVERLSPCLLRLGVTEGRYHQVKRMLAAVGNHVEALHREQVGDLRLDPALQPGEYRALTEDEINLFRGGDREA